MAKEQDSVFFSFAGIYKILNQVLVFLYGIYIAVVTQQG